MAHDIAFPVLIGTPADEGAAGLHPAGVKCSSANRCELTRQAAWLGPPIISRPREGRRRRGLTIFIITPADDGAVGLHPAGVQPPGADGGEGTGGHGVAWPQPSLEPQQTTERSVFTPQVWRPPALTEANRTLRGGVASKAISSDWSLTLQPQQMTEPSVFTPQVCESPALTEANSPVGGVDCPYLLEPQQTIEPSVFTPQV